MTVEHERMVDSTQAKAALDELMAAFLASVSFDARQRPDYEHIRALFIARGLLIKNVEGLTEICGVDEFMAPRLELVDSGALTQFRETEEAATTSIFGTVGHRWSSYSKSGVLNDEAFDARGIILTQFVETSEGWRISSMTWDDERDGLTLDDAYEVEG